jgi:hypothetical protein
MVFLGNRGAKTSTDDLLKGKEHCNKVCYQIKKEQENWGGRGERESSSRNKEGCSTFFPLINCQKQPRM